MTELLKVENLVKHCSEETRGHGTVGLAALWAEECRAFLESVPASLTAP